MERADFEKALVERLRDIEALYKRYNEGDSGYLSMALCDGCIMANNNAKAGDKHPVQLFVNEEGDIDHLSVD